MAVFVVNLIKSKQTLNRWLFLNIAQYLPHTTICTLTIRYCSLRVCKEMDRKIEIDRYIGRENKRKGEGVEV
jgi:hypothetical protein